MADTWDDLDEHEVTVQDEVLEKKNEFDKVFLRCIMTPEGSAMLKLLRERLVERPMYAKGDKLEDVVYRQAQADVVGMIDKCVKDAV